MKSWLIVAALAALTLPAYAQDQKAPNQMPQAGQGMMMPPDMMARMNKMMDQCEKMMASGDMKGLKGKGMPRQKKS